MPDRSSEAALDQIIRSGNRFHWKMGDDYRIGDNWFLTGDGSRISVIAGWGTYCSPRPGWPLEWGGAAEDYEGPFDRVEAWLPEHSDPESTDVTGLREWIAAHGGLVAGPVGTESDLSDVAAKDEADA